MPVADLFREAVDLQQCGRLRDAAERHASVLRQQPDHYGALQLLGVIRAQLGDMTEAARLLEKAVKQRPTAAECRNNYGLVLHGLGRYDEAVAQYRQAIALNPRYAVACNNLGNALAALRQNDAAIFQYRKALSIEPGYVQAQSNLGAALLSAGHAREAVEQLQAAVGSRPDFTEGWLNLGNALAALGQHPGASDAFAKVLAQQPGNATAHLGRGNALRASGRADDAAYHLRKACTLQPGLAPAHTALGLVLQELGRIDEARASFELAVALEPERPGHFLRLVNVTSLPPDDTRTAAMKAIAVDADKLDLDERISLHFALGKALADTGQHDQAFDHLLTGNALHRGRIRYHEARVLGRMERTRSVFSREPARQLAGTGDPSEQPIFILGMPRSGSTLVEQVLASHPSVFAVGETTAFRDGLGALALADSYPDNVPELTGDMLRELGASYLTRINAAARGKSASRITDKLPANFRYAGLIHLALPNARIIHTRRDPIDTCLSCFSVFFERQPFTFDLAELGRYYRCYDRLMAHWHDVLPAGVILDVQYEDLVNDFEAQARRLVEFCRLEWNDACLEFHRATRPVRTASVVQVRQPLYRTSVGRWRPDAATLKPLLDALADN